VDPAALGAIGVGTALCVALAYLVVLLIIVTAVALASCLRAAKRGADVEMDFRIPSVARIKWRIRRGD
jgi:hypothetical protein